MTSPGPTTVVSGAAATELNLAALRPAPRMTAANDAEARKVGREFEAMFLTQMLQPMFDTIEPDPIFGGGYGEQVFRSLQVEQFAKAVTRAGGIGLADSLAREMMRLQEQANG